MQRNKASYRITPNETDILKARVLNWSSQFNTLIFLDNNSYPSIYSGYECLVAAGLRKTISNTTAATLNELDEAHKDWIFGHICYDSKNVLEPKLTSAHPAKHMYPLSGFFIPETVCYINRLMDTFTIETFGNPDEIYQEISRTRHHTESDNNQPITFTRSLARDEYIGTIEKLREHIAAGDCYEINYCSSSYAEEVTIDPISTFQSLNRISPAPFAAYYRLEDKYTMCSSPERYLRKEGARLTSQPIKGTAKRGADEAADNIIRQSLRNDIKELAENVMIVDLVRNDLARCCETGSIQVDELFGIYTFPQVHQMISTVSGRLCGGATLEGAIQATFPMGSMTGAPKFKVMELIEQYEKTRRELYSGSIGYIAPNGDFDFNVVIRSLFYNETDKFLSFHTGGAITYDSIPEREWEELRLKAWAMEQVFEKKIPDIFTENK